MGARVSAENTTAAACRRLVIVTHPWNAMDGLDAVKFSVLLHARAAIVIKRDLRYGKVRRYFQGSMKYSLPNASSNYGTISGIVLVELSLRGNESIHGSL